MTTKNDAEALVEYMKAFSEYNNKLDEYFPISRVIPGQKLKAGKVLTIEVISELDKMGKDVEEKRKTWISFLDKKR
jgi:hypothetical protein